MKCEKYLDLIDELVKGELDEETAGEVNLHIFACTECASDYEILAQEKKMYARYLFEIKPPNDLPVKFRAQLNSEAGNISRISWLPMSAFGWKASLAGFLRLHPASVGAIALIVFGIGFGLLRFMPVETMRTEKEVAKTEPSSIQFPTANPVETDKDASTDLTAKAISGDYVASSKRIINPDVNRFSDAKRAAEKNLKSGAIKPTKIKKQINSANENEDLAAGSQLSKEAQTRISQSRNLEKEIAKQIEKIELLLRSFRNARTVDGGEVFDISYEKQRAKKLLEMNAQLKRIAENYGALYAEEILLQVEPYLLEISNLEINPSLNKVLDIKERVKSQNLIASLQAYY